MNNTLIKIKNLTVSYDGYEALQNVDLEIYDNDFLGVIGPNGGGKTTLVKAILGQVKYSGDISFGKSIQTGNTNKIGYLPQQSNIDRKFPISLQEVVMSGLQSEKKFTGSYGASDRLKANALLEMTGIIDIKDKQIGEVSGGQFQRALLCRAIISDPQVLILDEPANFVDNKFEKELYETLKALNERMAVIMVSHDLGTITSVVKSIVCVNRHVHRHESNVITAEQLYNYDCPIQIISHGDVPHTVLHKH